MQMIISRPLTPLDVKSSRTLQIRRASDQAVHCHDDNSRRKCRMSLQTAASSFPDGGLPSERHSARELAGLLGPIGVGIDAEAVAVAVDRLDEGRCVRVGFDL